MDQQSCMFLRVPVTCEIHPFRSPRCNSLVWRWEHAWVSKMRSRYFKSRNRNYVSDKRVVTSGIAIRHNPLVDGVVIEYLRWTEEIGWQVLDMILRWL